MLKNRVVELRELCMDNPPVVKRAQKIIPCIAANNSPVVSKTVPRHCCQLCISQSRVGSVQTVSGRTVAIPHEFDTLTLLSTKVRMHVVKLPVNWGTRKWTTAPPGTSAINQLFSRNQYGNGANREYTGDPNCNQGQSIFNSTVT